MKFFSIAGVLPSGYNIGKSNCLLYIIIILFIIVLNKNVMSSEKDLISLAESFNKNGEYYNAITEITRYQYLYPNGSYYPLSMLILSEAFYKGGNYNKSINTLTECYEKFRNKPEGEKAFYKTGYVQMTSGSPYLAFRIYQEYRYLYKDGSFIEDTSRDLCYSLTLMNNLKEAKNAVRDYEEHYAEGRYLQEINELQILIDEEINRPKKSVWVSVLGSIVVPGFGHFYTGKYELGVLSLVSNAVLIYLFYDGYKDKSKARMIIFGLSEFSFYQYSLYSSISNVYEYNNNDQFYKTIRLSASKEF
jgi:outer membrane protein assembly factor BamD (BamD/ComL family)